MEYDFLADEKKRIDEEIERLRAWDERVAREKEANDKEAAELAIIIAQEKLKPTLDDRVIAVETDIDSVIEALDAVFGGV